MPKKKTSDQPVLRRHRKRAIPLEAKLQPTQMRGQDTYESVLATAGTMLNSIGFEQLTTNKICAQAGITPPALYRYFPNKYAILKALGERLMQAQDESIHQWVGNLKLPDVRIELWIENISGMLRGIIDATNQFNGGAAIMRAVRSVPVLQQLHRDSRETVTQGLLRVLQVRNPDVPKARLLTAARMMAELSSAVAQMAVEEPGADTEYLIYEAAFLFASYVRSFRTSPPGNLPY